MKISKKWRLLLIPITLGALIWCIQYYMESPPNTTNNTYLKHEKIGHETRYTITIDSIKEPKLITIKVRIESNEHPETHTEPLLDRVLLTVNNTKPIIPQQFTKLSQDQYHIKGLLTFALPKEIKKVAHLTLSIFDHEEHTFQWTLSPLKKTNNLIY